MANNTNNNPSFQRNDQENSQRRLMLHNHITVDNARQLRDNFNNVIREIQPLVEIAVARNVNAGVQSAISMTNFLNRSHSEPATHMTSTNQDFVINLEEVSPETVPRPERVPDETFNVNNNNPEDSNNLDRAQTILEGQLCLQAILKYVPLFLILIAKSFYDYHEAVFIIFILFLTFAHTNTALKKETTKRQRRSLGTLGIELLYIVACAVFIQYVFADKYHNFDVVLNVVLIRTITHPLTVGNLLWIVTITDFALKLITVSIKILLTMMPGRIVPFQKRGKMYLFIEAVSQLYRSFATIQPWFNFLLESYQGPEKIIAVFWSAFYMISKGNELMSRLKLLKTAFLKLLQNVAVGSPPSKEQIQTAGEHCPICHDQYETPVLLQCRHIFCESCVTTWFDREQTCPLCRAKIVDDPSWRDGSTTYFIQLY